MGYEVAEQLGWKLPQGIIYPTGGGVGLLGMWKAFDEMEQLGFIGPERPNMISVQAAGCAPIVKAWDEGRPSVRNVAERLHYRRRPARAQTLRRLPHSRHSQKKRRPRPRRHRRRNSRSHSPLGQSRRHLRRPRRRSLAGRLPKTPRQRLLQPGRHRRPVQHRLRPEISGCAGYERCGAATSPASRAIAGIIGPY